MNKTTGSIREQFKQDRFWPYCRRAFAWIAFLMIMSFVSKYLPPFVIPIVIILYALFSTCGALYPVEIKRKHKQYKLAEEGHLSRINRRWVISLIVSFIIALVSGFLFLLQSPTWDLLEWLLIWLAVPAFFVLFETAKSKLSKEFKPWYLKATAMRVSFFILAVFLGIIYAVVASQASPYDSMSFSNALSTALANDYFNDAQTALLSEASYVATTVNVVSSLGATALSQSLGEMQAPIAWAINFIACISILFGLISQYGCCLLTREEIESEFRLLPDPEKEEFETPYVKRYFVILGALIIVTCIAFGTSEYYLKKAETSGVITPVKQWIEEREKEFAPIADVGLEQAGEALEYMGNHEASEQENQNKRNELLAQINKGRLDLVSTLTGPINEYYDGCRDKVDAYVDWYYGTNDGLFDKIKRFFAAKTTEAALEHFKETVVNSGNINEIEDSYKNSRQEIQDGLGTLINNLSFGNVLPRKAEEEADSLSGPNELNVWSGSDNESFAKEYLIPKDGESEEEFRNRLKSMVEDERQNTLQMLDDSFQNSIDMQSLLDLV